MSIIIKVRDCKYFLDLNKLKNYPYDDPGDCDHVRGPGGCDHERCPISLMRKLPNLSGINKAIRDAEYIMKCLEMVRDQVKTQSSEQMVKKEHKSVDSDKKRTEKHHGLLSKVIEE